MGFIVVCNVKNHGRVAFCTGNNFTRLHWLNRENIARYINDQWQGPDERGEITDDMIDSPKVVPADGYPYVI
jgi:hypothetical protein